MRLLTYYKKKESVRHPHIHPHKVNVSRKTLNTKEFNIHATVTLNDGNRIPAVGFDVFQIPADGSTYTAVKEALEVGYRHIDTAQAYFNEKEVGQAIKDSGIPRDEIFVTSKLWIQDYAYETAKATVDATLEKMELDYLDLYLLHQPYGKVEEAWKALEEAKAAGQINRCVKLHAKLLESICSTFQHDSSY